jgi:hypothetical protein
VKAQLQEERRLQEESRRLEKEQAKKAREERKQEERRLQKAEQASKAREERKQLQEQEKEQAAIINRKQREVEANKRPFNDAIGNDPRDAAAYIRLADFLIEAAGLQDSLREMQDMDPIIFGGILNSLRGWIRFQIAYPELFPPRPGNSQMLAFEKPLLVEAKDAYFKAIALSAEVDSYASACYKLTYVFISFLSLADPHDVTFTNEAIYYAREAEKDLRKHLRKEPDDTAALQKMALSIAIYQKNESTRTQRLASVNARVKEAEARLQLHSRPPPRLNPPGSPDSPYPDNWDEIREAVKDRDHHRCTQCDAVDVELHVHHIVPLSRGGANDWDNLVTLCDICHKEEHSGG